MKIAVIGRDGQLARSLVRRAASAGDVRIDAIGRDDLDLARPETIAPALGAGGFDVIINAAAYTAVDAAEDDEATALAVNATGAGEVARVSAALGARLIHVSTDYVFDGSGMEARDEAHPTAPLGAYGRSKLAGEDQVREANGISLIVRTAWVYSPFGKNFVKTMIALAQERDEIRVVDDQIGNPTSALDLADGLLRAATVGWDRHRLYHLAGTGTASWADLAEAVMDECQRLGRPAARILRVPTSDFPTRAIRPRNSILDSRRFAEDFDFVMPAWRNSLSAIIGESAKA